MDTASSLQGEKIQAPLLIIGLLVLLTVGISLLPASWLGINKQVSRYEPLNLGSLAAYGSGATDVDEDGTVSWKEYITQSLSLSPEEATSSIEIDVRETAALNDPNNLTSSFTKNLFIASTALKQNGIVDPAVEQDTLNQLVKKEAEKITIPVYTEGSIKLSSDSSKAALKTYGNAVGSILGGILTKEAIAAELLSVNSFVQSENEGDLLPVVKDSAKVQTAIDKLLALKVPKSAVQTHLSVLNKLGSYGTTLDNITRAYDDPIRATFAIYSYVDVTLSALQSFSLLDSFFDANGVVFTAQETGYLFARYTNTK